MAVRLPLRNADVLGHGGVVGISDHGRRVGAAAAVDGEGNLLLGAVERGHREGVDLGVGRSEDWVALLATE